MEDLKNIKECPDCASMNVLYSQIRDQIICRDCGLIFEPLVPELESRLERTHGLKLSKSKNFGRPSKLKKSIKKPKATTKTKVKAVKKVKVNANAVKKTKAKTVKAKLKPVKKAKLKPVKKTKIAKSKPPVATKPEQKKRKGFFWRR